VALTACGGDETTAPVDEPLPDPLTFPVDDTGPFNVGHRLITTSYESPADLGTRTIELNLWYPTSDTEGPTPTYSMLFDDEDVISDASALPPAYDGGYPVLVHSHGHRGYGGNSSDLMRHFASHGWLVVAPEHLDDTLLNAKDPRPFHHYFQRPLDIGAALDALENLPDDDPVAGQMDMTNVAMTGHSFGTYVTWAIAGAAYDTAAIQTACDSGDLSDLDCTPEKMAVFETDLSDPRVEVAIPMAGGARDSFFGDDGYDAASVPMLLMTGSDDDVGAQALFDKVGGVDLTWIEVAGGCHQLFGYGDCPDIANDVGFPIVNTYALAFARRYALDDDDPTVTAIVEGDQAVSDLVSYETK
jgi:predicted dienelactone hydrolase